MIVFIDFNDTIILWDEHDDIKKQHPDMLPYNRLPESEKEYDRLMAMNTIKLVKKLGWKFMKR